MTPSGLTQTKKATRRILGLAAYRWVVTFLLLIALFKAFPDHGFLVGAGFIYLSLIESAFLETSSLARIAADDAARLTAASTRQTVAVAQEWALLGEPAGGPEFWSEVTQRTAADFEVADEPDVPTPWYKAGALILWSFASRAFWDLLFVGICYALSGSA